MGAFQWKIPLKVKAEDAAAELDRIYQKHGIIDPQTVVDESKDDGAVLHSLFEWDEAKAANKYRCQQAQFIIRNITTEEKNTVGESITVRAFERAEHRYAPTSAIMSQGDLRKLLLDRALAELHEFEQRYKHLSELAEVFASIDALGAA